MADQVKIKFGPAKYNTAKAIRDQIEEVKTIAEASAGGGGGDTFVETLGETIITPVVPEFKWLGPAIRNSSSSSNLVNNATNIGRIFFTLFVVNSETTFDQIAARTAVANSTTRVRFGIYNEYNGRPDLLVYDAGDFLIDATGVQIRPFEIPQTLQPGRYYVATVFQDTVTTLGAISGRISTGPAAHRWHDNPGSAMGDSSASNPAFFTAANTYTSGGLPADTTNGDILSVDSTGNGLSYFPAVSLRSGDYAGFLFDYERSYIYAASEPIGSTVYFVDRANDAIAGVDLATGLTAAPILLVPGQTGSGDEVSRILKADGTIWITSGNNFPAGPGDSTTVQVLNYYDGVSTDIFGNFIGWTAINKNVLAQIAYGLPSPPPITVMGISKSPHVAVYNDKIYTILKTELPLGVPNVPFFKIVTVNKTGVVDVIDVPAAVDVNSNPSLQVRNGHVWVFGNVPAYYDGTTWSVFAALPSLGGGANYAISSDGSALIFQATQIRKLTTAGVLTTTASGWQSWQGTVDFVQPFGYSNTEILILRDHLLTAASNAVNVNNYVYNTVTDTVSLAIDEPSRVTTWAELASASQYNGRWVVLRNQQRPPGPSNLRLQYVYTF